MKINKRLYHLCFFNSKLTVLMVMLFSILCSSQELNNKKEDSLLNLLSKEKSIKKRVKLLHSLRRINARKDKNKSIFYLKELRKNYSNDEKYLKNYIDITQHLGWYYTVKAEVPDSAAVLLKESLQLAKELKDTMLIGKGLTYTGLMYQRKGYYKRAMSYFLKSLPYKEALGESNRISFSYNLIGEVYEAQGDYKKGLEYHFKALKLRESLEKNDFHIAHSYLNISKTFYGDKQFVEALNYAQKALDKYEIIGSGHNKSKSFNYKGKALLELGRFVEAINSFKEVLKLYEEIKIDFLKVEALNGLANVYLKKNDYNKALNYAKEALSIAVKHEYVLLRMESYEVISEVF